jgi:hypothetical protein
MTSSLIKDVQKAAEDFRYLLNQGYPRKAALELVGNRYQLTSDQRHLLHRGVFSDRDSNSRLKKNIPPHRIRGKNLVIDGYNVIITIEAGVSGRPLVLADDGFIRDISGLSGNFKKTVLTGQALQLLSAVLKQIKPRRTLFLFDSPISKSGELAWEARNILKRENLPGDSIAVKVPEKMMIGFLGVIATSDTAIIDQSKTIVDLAGYIVKNLPFRRLKSAAPYSIIRWRKKRDTFGKK